MNLEDQVVRLGKIIGILLEDQAYLYEQMMQVKFPEIHNRNWHQEWLDALAEAIVEVTNEVAEEEPMP